LKELRYPYRRKAEIILLGLMSLVLVTPGLLTAYLKGNPKAFPDAPWLRNATPQKGWFRRQVPPKLSDEQNQDVAEWQKAVERPIQ
jgi:hypothetical protein